MMFAYPEHWNAIDALLVIVLCVALPAQQLVRSIYSSHAALSLAARAIRSLLRLGVPLAVLTYNWWATGRPASALGLDVPISFTGQIALLVAAIASAGLVILSSRPIDVPRQLEAIDRLKSSGLLIQTRAEAAIFVPQAFLIGCGSEILFRGFLLWAFAPVLGTIGAVVIAGLAYGLGHGFRTWRDGIGTLVSAFLFASAYAFTESLWWLMLFHTVIGLNAGWMGYRMTRASENRGSLRP
jgi:membrane protease YdiL (CAAX protease family)